MAPDSRLRARTARRGGRHLAAVLARLPDGGADRQGAEAEAGDHRRHRLGPRRSAGRDRARHHGRRGHLQQQHQRVRARGDDDPVAGAQLHPVVPVGGQGRLEHRRLRVALLRPRGDGRRHGRRRAHRLGGAAAAEALRRQAALHRPAPASGQRREGTGRHLPPERRVDGARLRRGHDQRAAASGDRAPVQRRAHRQDEARRLPREHGARQDLRSRRHRPRAGERAARRLRRRRLVPAAGAARTTRGGRCRTTA